MSGHENALAAAASRLFEDLDVVARVSDGVVPATAVALVREAVQHLGWGTMRYRCGSCGYETRIWLALGVEGPPALRDANLYVACPFTVACFACAGPPAPRELTDSTFAEPMNGTMSHVAFGDDDEFAPRLIPDAEPWFRLPEPGAEHGQLVVPSNALVAGRRWFHEERGR